MVKIGLGPAPADQLVASLADPGGRHARPNLCNRQPRSSLRGKQWVLNPARLPLRRNQQSGRPLSNEHTLFEPCPWAGCRNAPRPGAVLCEDHIVKIVHEPLSDFATFIKDLPYALGAEIAESSIYHAVNTAVHVGMFAGHSGHELMRTANSYRTGRAPLDVMIDRLLQTIVPHDRGEFMMHLKRHLLVPERRSMRRDAAHRAGQGAMAARRAS